MSILPAAIILGILAPVTYLFARKVFPKLVRKKAIRQLEASLFPDGNGQKSEVIKCCRELTGARFRDEEILDYFMKMKGLQTVNVNSRTNFWLKKYLFTPAPIKLNYFEQVKFYEMFLNFPGDNQYVNENSTTSNKSENRTKTEQKSTIQHRAKQEKTI